MDGCFTMAWIYHGVRSYFEQYSGHSVFIHSQNHRLALCFTHLIPKHDNFVKFDSLLLNVYLLLKNSTVKSNVFEEVHNTYRLKLLWLIKAVTTQWLSLKKVVEREYLIPKALSCLAWCNIFEKERTGNKVLLYCYKNVRHACKKL